MRLKGDSSLHFVSLLMFLLSSCIVEYIPKTDEETELINVEGLITDQRGINTVKLSKSVPLWNRQVAKPLKGCIVTISDDLGYIYNLKETNNGYYITDSATFQGVIGRKYSLHISTTSEPVNYSYSSLPMEMKPVPPIDRIYYEKRTFQHEPMPAEGCQIYLDSHDPVNKCDFYRWSYSETWELRLPFEVVNKVCWRTVNSNGIFIKNTSLLVDDRITRYPINSISDPVDRLRLKYSILVKQYSLNEDEYLYWQGLKTTLDQIGGLYDLIPNFIPNNIYCVENPNQKILGYFSVSAVSSGRLFIKDNFNGYDESCISGVKFGLPKFDWDPRSPSYGKDTSIVGLDATVWVAEDHTDEIPPYRILVHTRWCSDCTKKGIFGEYRNIKPSFWDEDN
jgi:hypothetical protein